MKLRLTRENTMFFEDLNFDYTPPPPPIKTDLTILKESFDNINIYYYEIIDSNYTYISLKTKNQKLKTTVDELEQFIKFKSSNGELISY